MILLKIHQNADSIWNFQRYKLVFEFYETDSYPPPLNIIAYILNLSIFIKNKLVKNVNNKNDKGKILNTVPV